MNSWLKNACVVLAGSALAATTAGCANNAPSDAATPAAGGNKAVSAPSDVNGSTGIVAGTGARAASAKKAGEKAAAAAGGTAKLPAGEKIGFVNIVGGLPPADRLQWATQTALAFAGYKTVTCDGKGDPATMSTCFNTLLSQNVNAIFTNGVSPSVVAAPLRQAKSKGVPVIDVGGIVGPGYDANYAPDESRLGKVMAAYLVKKLDGLGGQADVAVHDFPAPWGALRTQQFTKAIAGDSHIKVTAKATTDAANVVQGTKKTVTDELTQNPNLKAFWFAWDTAGQAGGQVIGSKFAGKSFPDRPLVVTFHADPGTQQLIKSGAIDAVADVPYDIGAWVGVDQLLEHLARGTKLSGELQPSYPGVGSLYDYPIVTKDNLPTQGKYIEPKVDVVSFFEAKWNKEFGL